MILHKDADTFAELIAFAAEQRGLPQVYIEKDYWITRALQALSNSGHGVQAIFKGGTSLSKAHRLIDRFSEDIDLAIFNKDMGDARRKRQLKQVEQAAAHELIVVKNDPRESKGSYYRKTVYQYPRSIDSDTFGQASPELLIEVNAFTNPEPFERMTLQSAIAEELINNDREELVKLFQLQGFDIDVLSVRRTLTEKILGVIKDSYHENPVAKLSDRIRHLYDICMILKLRKKYHHHQDMLPLKGDRTITFMLNGFWFSKTTSIDTPSG
ncbi:MAG: nucleotidyl transferase AbiEii/AbiGii toxin family protein [Pseudomonadales bacterium]